MKGKLEFVEWVPVLRWKKVKEILMGSESEGIKFEETSTVGFISIDGVYEKISMHLQ